MLTAVMLWCFAFAELVPRSIPHPCDKVSPGRKVCNPVTGGRRYFLCRGNGLKLEFACPNRLVFDNNKQACDWDYRTRCTAKGVAPKPTITTTAADAGDAAAVASVPRSRVTVRRQKTTDLSTSRWFVSYSGSHPCDKATPNSKVCDPATGGRHYYLCGSGGIRHEFVCPNRLVFDNQKQACDWDDKTQCQAKGATPEPVTTSITTTTTTTSTATVVAAAFVGISLSSANAEDEATSPATEDFHSTSPWQDFFSPTAWADFFSTNAYADSSSTPAYEDPSSTPAYEDFFSTWAGAEGSTPYTEDTCNSWTCQLPHCRCMGTDIPGNLDVSDVPQMVLLTFDDAVKADNFHYFEGLFPEARWKAVRNPNGCRATATFFVSGTGTDMALLRSLVEKGNEVASHSHTHTSPSEWSRDDWGREIEGMRWRLALGVGLALEEVRGMRAPFLQLGGEDQFSMLHDGDFLYDSSMFGGSPEEDFSAPLWPFTLDYPPSPSQAMCDQPRCPAGSYPQLWEVPLIGQYTPSGQPCTMTDGCFLGSDATKDDIIAYLRYNFERHYERNRAPFMISLHATWFDNVPESYQALEEFLRDISLNTDVWQVTLTQMLDWVRHPLPLSRVSEIASWRCDEETGSVRK